ncbi:YgjV family protein [Agromyces humi]|uniref:YgjV family protein n=1 Tax=Agromyces humi TaxID=1766800 RepID=UPI00135B6A0F|nr:YgjV family protein [Agromyces humi]
MPEIGSALWITSQAFAAIGYPIRLFGHWQKSRTRTLAASALGAAFQILSLACLGLWAIAAVGLISVIRNMVHLGSDRMTRAQQVATGLTFAAVAVGAYYATAGGPTGLAWWFPVASVTITAIGQSFPDRLAVKLSAFAGTGFWVATYVAAGSWVAALGDTIGCILAVVAITRIVKDRLDRRRNAGSGSR